MANDLGLKMRLKAVDKMSAAINKVKKSTSKLTSSVDRANKKFNRMKAITKGVSKNLKNVGGRMKSIGAGMSVGLTAPIIAMGAAIVKTSASFQAGMNKVEALTGATGKSLEDMTKLARQLGRDTKFSATEAADAMAFLGQAGFKTNEILAATPGILNLAAASNMDLARSADIASNVMGAFNIKASETGRVADVLSKVTASANVDMEMLAESFKDAGPVALKYGASLEQTAALIGKLGDAGIQGSKAGTTLKNMFLKISAPTAGAKKLLLSLGVNAVDPLTKKLKPMTQILKDLNKGFKLKNLTQAAKLDALNRIFGQRAIAGAGVLLNAVEQLDPKTGKVVDTISELTTELNNANGTAQKMAKTLMKGLPGAIARLKSSTEDMLLSFGFKGGFAGLAEAVIERLIKLTNWISKLSPTTLKVTAAIAGMVAVIGPLLAAFGLFLTMLPTMITGWGLFSSALTIVTGIIPTIIAGLSGVITALGSMAVAAGAALVPFLPIIAVVGLLATAAVMLYNAWEPIKAFFSDLFTNPLQEIKDMVSYAGSLASKVGSFLGFGDGKSDVDKQLEAQGFKLGGGAAKGEPLGAKKVNSKSDDFKQRQKKSQIDINFANMPKGTNVISSDEGGMLGDIRLGMMGAI